MPFRSPQGEGRFESASARRLRCPFSFVCCTRFVKWIPYVEVRRRRRFERDCPDSGATVVVSSKTAGPICGRTHFRFCREGCGQIPGRAGCVHFAEGVWERTGGRSGEADCNAGSAALSLIPSPSTIV